MTEPADTTGDADPADPADFYGEDVIAGRPPGEPFLHGQAAAVAAVGVGGAVGAVGRWALATSFPPPPGGFPVTTFAVNVVGCLLMGVLVVLVTEAREAHPIVRPFLGVGVLGGFTTFSSYAVETQQLLGGGRLGVALAYLGATVLAAVAAVVVGLRVTRRLVGAR